MSVFKSQRSEPVAEFLTATMHVHINTMKVIKKFPKSYRWLITNEMLELASKAFTFAVRANSIYVFPNMNTNDYELRHFYLIKSAGCLDALAAEVNVLYALIESGETTFKSKQERENSFIEWMRLIIRATQLVKGVAKSDNKRFDASMKPKPSSETLSMLKDAELEEIDHTKR